MGRFRQKGQEIPGDFLAFSLFLQAPAAGRCGKQGKGGRPLADILSVGIDIGTSTTQVVFSRLRMENTAAFFSVPHVSIVGKELVYRGEVHTTPLKTPVLIDGDAVRDIVAAEFRRAGFTPADTDTGAVIITGESARKENAATVLDKLSGFAGEFVVSTAGPDLESVIAGKGSGACQHSIDNECVTVNLDIGGGTTNIAVFDRGETAGKGCLDIGGRLVRITPDRRIESVSPPAERVAQAIGLSLRPGDRADPAALAALTDKMADLLAQALGAAAQEPLLRAVQTPESTWLEPPRNIQAICFSGGVADCIRGGEGEDPFRYGDIGPLLGRSIREGALCRTFPVMEAGETIRATVVGAGTYTTTLSGSTIAYDAGLFPMKNLPVLKLTAEEEGACFQGCPEPLERRLRWFLEQTDDRQAVVSLRGLQDPSYSQLKALARALAQGLDRALPRGVPAIAALECDMAKALGGAMRTALGGRRPVVCIDGVKVTDGDYVDLGRPLMEGLVIPVVVKTLLFG